MPARSAGRGNCAARTAGNTTISTSVNRARMSYSWGSKISGFFALNDFDRFRSVLLEERQQTGVEEPDLEQHQERHGAVDAVAQRVEQRRREIEPERDFDHRLHRHRLAVLL